MAKSYSELSPSIRTLMGPGPSSVHPRVLRAMTTPLVGYLDPDFFKVMEEVKELLRYVLQTANELTIPVSGTGSAGMETCISNLVETGDEVLVCVNGYFGERMCEIVDRYGGKVKRIDTPWGKVVEPNLIDEALRLVQEEGLEARFKRHELNHRALVAGLDAMGIKMFVEESSRLWSLNATCVPEGVDDARVRGRLLNEFNIEIGGGFGALKGKIWRIGLMGYSSSKNNVFMFLAALENVLTSEGYSLKPGAGVGSASSTYNE